MKRNSYKRACYISELILIHHLLRYDDKGKRVPTRTNYYIKNNTTIIKVMFFHITIIIF